MRKSILAIPKYIKSFSLVGADTSRTRAYLHSLSLANLLPSETILLTGGAAKTFGKQEFSSKNELIDRSWPEASFNASEPLLELSDRLKLNYKVIPTDDINDFGVISYIKKSKNKIFLFSGFGGNLLRSEILGIGKFFLHVHGGYLPDFPGSTSNYYSMLKTKTIGASSIFLTKQIDGGPVIYKEKFDIPKNTKNFDHIYDPAVRSRVLIKTLNLLFNQENETIKFKKEKHREMFYIIHPVLKHLAILKNSH